MLEMHQIFRCGYESAMRRR